MVFCLMLSFFFSALIFSYSDNHHKRQPTPSHDNIAIIILNSRININSL